MQANIWIAYRGKMDLENIEHTHKNISQVPKNILEDAKECARKIVEFGGKLEPEQLSSNAYMNRQAKKEESPEVAQR